MARRPKVREGQHYAEFNSLSRTPRLWQVERIFDGPASKAHARLVDVRYRHDVKTISCATLADHSSYTPLAAEAAEAAEAADTNKVSDTFSL